MATNENLIPIPGRLHSVATEGHVAGADEIYDDSLQKTQDVINAEIDEVIDDVALIDTTESSPAVVPGFDPQTDTVHVTAQTLSETQKAQVRNNIGLGDVDAKISQAVASEAIRAQQAESALGSRVQSVEVTKADKNSVYTIEQGSELESAVNTTLSLQDEKMDNIQATVNAKQLEIGAVETDLEPTEDSPNILTSGTLYDTYGYYANNPEYIHALVDNNKKVLEAILKDSSKKIFTDLKVAGEIISEKGISMPAASIYNTVNQEWKEVVIDGKNNILFGIKNDGKIYGSISSLPDGILDSKQDKEPGKGLSTNDFSDNYKEYLDAEAVPDYYFNNEYLQNKILKFENIRLKGGMQNDAFVFVTDTHVARNKQHGSHSIQLIDYIIRNTTINKVINGGDIQGHWTEEFNDLVKEATENNKWASAANKHGADYFGCRGNHDFTAMTYDGQAVHFHDGFSIAAIWNYFIGQYAGVNDKIVFNDADVVKDEIYFYYDNNASKIRYICIDAMYTTNSGDVGYGKFSKIQSDWIYDSIVEAPEGFSIVFITHIPPISTATEEVPRLAYFISGVINKTTININNTDYNFSSAPDVLLTIAGHKHQDHTVFANGGLWIVTASDSQNQDDIGYYYKNQYPVYPIDGTITEQCIDMVCVDAAIREVNCVRIGVGSDRKMHLDYININVGEQHQLTTTLEGEVTWFISNSTGHSFTGSSGTAAQVWEQNSDYATITNGLISAVSAGEATAVAIDSNGNFEFWGVKIQ